MGLNAQLTVSVRYSQFLTAVNEIHGEGDAGFEMFNRKAVRLEIWGAPRWASP